MTGLKLVSDICKSPDYASGLEFYTKPLKKVLKIGGKDLRAAPLVKLILESMSGQKEENILKALEITEEKLKSIDEKVLSPRYFIIVLKNQIDQSKQGHIFNKEDVVLQWGKSI
jgi:hypothetical protein